MDANSREWNRTESGTGLSGFARCSGSRNRSPTGNSTGFNFFFTSNSPLILLMISKFVFCLFMLLLVPAVWADGKVFGRAEVSSVQTPDQRAMLYFSNKTERLVIETSFVGPGTNFAWIVPLPSVPKIEMVSTNFFRYLNATFQPRLIHKASSAWFIIGLGGFFLASAMIMDRSISRKRVFLRIVFILCLLGVFLILVLPLFVKARGSAGSVETSVIVHGRETIGVFETVTISGTNGLRLTEWLNSEGFFVPTEAVPAILNYASNGWVFAAARVNRAAGAGERSQPHPLSFTFESPAPVYPLALTGVGNDRCDIQLFVFGPGRAAAKGFEVEYCGEPQETPKLGEAERSMLPHSLPDPGEYLIANPELRRLAMPAPVVTQLRGTLTSEEMQSDAWIDWKPYEAQFPTFYSKAAGITAALNWFVGICVVGFLLILRISPRLGWEKCLNRSFWIFLIAGSVGLARYSLCTTAEVRRLPHALLVRNDLMHLSALIEIENFESKDTSAPPPTFEQFTNSIGQKYSPGTRNVFTREPIRHEATPGNLLLQDDGQKVIVLWYDLLGGSHQVGEFAKKRETN